MYKSVLRGYMDFWLLYDSYKGGGAINNTKHTFVCNAAHMAV